MTDINPENAVLTELLFGVGGIVKQMETVEAIANRTALTVKQAFAQTELGAPINTSQMTAQQAMIARITAEGETNKARIMAEGEAKISAIQAKESLTRQQIAQKEAATQLAITKQQVAQEQVLYMQSRRAAFEDKPTGMGGLMERRMSWLGTGALVMGGFTGIAETVQTIKDVEMGMTTIARVTEDVTFNFKGMRDELQQTGVDFGKTWNDGLEDIAVKWAQAGYDMQDTLELSEDSLLALNTAELNSEQATSGMIAIMAQWGLTAEELLPTIDKINKVADDFAITSTDLVSGLTRSSGAAKVLGLTMNETIAILTTMREATGRTGKEVGNALNSILSFMQRPVAIKAFETEGIQVFADEARTRFRNVIQIFDEMAQKWPQMSEASRNAMADQAEAAGLYTEEMSEVLGMEQQYNDIQQRNLSQAAAGIYRRNYLLALLQNWSKVDEVLISQENSLGYSMKENERTMQTLEKQIEVLKASAEQLAVALGDAGLLNELTGLVEGITDVVQWFNGLDDDMQMFLLTVLEVTAAVKLLDVALKSLGVSALLTGGTKVAGLAALGVSFKTAAKDLAGITAVATGAGAAIKTLLQGLLRFVGGPIGATLITIGTGLAFIAREANKASDELQEHAVMAEGLIGEYDSLTSKLNGMTKGTDEYNKTAKELYGLKSSIAKSLPELIDGWDSETESLKINRQEMQNMIDAGKDLKKAKEELAASDAKIAGIQEERKASENKIQEWESELNVLNDLADRREKLTKTLAAQKEGSEDAQKTEEALGETERLIADIAEEAGLKRNATIDAIIDKIKDERIAEAGRVKQKYADERELVAAAKQGALDRLKVLDEEIAVSKSLLPGGKWYEDIPILLKGKYNPLGEGRTRLALAKDQKESAEQQKILNAKNAELNKLDNAIKEAERTIANINADSALGSGGPPPPPGGGGSGSSKAKEIDYISEALGRLADSSKQFELANMGMESSLSSVNNLFDVAGAEYDYLNSRIEAGTATMADHARMQELVGTKTALLKNEQMQLTNANQQYQQEIDALTPLLAKATSEYERFKAVGDEEHMEDAAKAVSSLKGEIDSLSGAIASNTQEIWANKGALDQLANSAYSAYYQQTMDWMKHMEAIGQMNNELQAGVLDGFKKEKLTRQEQWKLEEDQFQNRLDRLQEERDAIKDAYDERMEQYEAEIEANDQLIESREKAIDTFKESIDSQIAELQKLMDALDDEGDKEDKEEAARQHNKKLAELQEKRLYHELRTGTEHVDAIADIDKQIAEENIAWQLRQNDWARDAQKEAYQDQIDSLRDQAKKHEDSARKEIDLLKKTNNAKKQEMQKFYNELEGILSDSNLRMMAASQEYGEQFVNRMREIATQATQAFNDNYNPDSVINNARGLIDDARSSSGGSYTNPYKPPSENSSSEGKKIKATVSPGQYINEGGRTYMKSQDLAGLLGKSVDWDGSNVVIGGKKFSPYKNVNGRTYVGIREVAEALGYSVNWDTSSGMVSILDKAHDGAKVLRDGAAVLKHDERVLSPNLAPSFDRLAMAITRTPDFSKFSFSNDNASLERKLDAVIAVMKSRQMIVDKAVNIEHVSFEDRADMQAFGVETRSILSAMG